MLILTRLSRMRNSMLATVALAAAFPVFAQNHGVSDLSAFRSRNSGTSIATLYKECTGNNFGDRTFCAGYISAMLDSMGMLGPAVSPKKFRICPKVSVNAGAAVQAFKNWARKHPQAWSLDRVFGVMWALKETWPCQ